MYKKRPLFNQRAFFVICRRLIVFNLDYAIGIYYESKSLQNNKLRHFFFFTIATLCFSRKVPVLLGFHLSLRFLLHNLGLTSFAKASHPLITFIPKQYALLMAYYLQNTFSHNTNTYNLYKKPNCVGDAPSFLNASCNASALIKSNFLSSTVCKTSSFC